MGGDEEVAFTGGIRLFGTRDLQLRHGRPWPGAAVGGRWSREARVTRRRKKDCRRAAWAY
jgi:hypothetical protein